MTPLERWFSTSPTLNVSEGTEDSDAVNYAQMKDYVANNSAGAMEMNLITMYNNDPQGAVSYINLAKRCFPSLIPEFIKECEEKGLTIPKGLLELL